MGKEYHANKNLLLHFFFWGGGAPASCVRFELINMVGNNHVLTAPTPLPKRRNMPAKGMWPGAKGAGSAYLKMLVNMLPCDKRPCIVST